MSVTIEMKIRLKISPVVLYGYETWILYSRGEMQVKGILKQGPMANI